MVSNVLLYQNTAQDVENHVKGMNEQNVELRTQNYLKNSYYSTGWLVVFGVCFLVFRKEVSTMVSKLKFLFPVMLLCFCGCIRPFEPVKLENIGPNEEGFLIPFIGDAKKQAATNSEEFLQANLVQAKQIKIPQQWVPRGFTWGIFYNNGQWQDAAMLIKVDRSPVTREWSADPNTGTSNKNKAVRVMTSDQVEFSTGWTGTAYLASSEDTVKFLHYYRNGSLEKVMDTEVRARIQTAFGLEVTDQSMETLRLAATPHIQKVVTDVTTFFKERGITITNLGISRGFIYKDQSIQKTMVELFNAEQAQAIATATAAALQKTAQGKADAAKLQAAGEAEAIKQVADAKAYEIEKATGDLETYLSLKRLELEGKKIEKWVGSYPSYYIGSMPPESLLTIPSPK